MKKTLEGELKKRNIIIIWGASHIQALVKGSYEGDGVKCECPPTSGGGGGGGGGGEGRIG